MTATLERLPFTDRLSSWEVRPDPDIDPFRAVDCPDDETLDRARVDLYSLSVPLAEACNVLALRYRHPLWDSSAAARFADRFVTELDQLATAGL